MQCNQIIVNNQQHHQDHQYDYRFKVEKLFIQILLDSVFRIGNNRQNVIIIVVYLSIYRSQFWKACSASLMKHNNYLRIVKQRTTNLKIQQITWFKQQSNTKTEQSYKVQRRYNTTADEAKFGFFPFSFLLLLDSCTTFPFQLPSLYAAVVYFTRFFM